MTIENKILKKFLITDNVDITYNKIFKIIDEFYGNRARKCSDIEEQLSNGFMIGFNNISKSVIKEIKLLKYVKVIE